MATKKAARKPVKRAAPARRSNNDVPQSGREGSFDNVDQGQPSQGRFAGPSRGNFSPNRNGSGSNRNTGKSAFTSVTGLWPGKKANTIGSGKCKGEQIEKILAVLNEALEKGVEVRFSVFAPGQYTHAQAMGDLALSLVDPNYNGGGRSAGRGYPQRSAPQRQNFRQPAQNQGWENQGGDEQGGEDVNFG